MAIVANRAGTTPTDKSYFVHNRSNAGSPNGALTPEYVGELVFDSTNKVRWKAIGKANTEWVPIEVEVT